MKKLILMRHAKAESEGVGGTDRLRPLHTRGEQEANLVGNYLKFKQIQPTIIVASYALRTMQTAEIIGDILGYNAKEILSSKAIYLGHANDIVELITEFDEKYDTAIIVGHNPTIAEILYHSVHDKMPEIFDFPTLCTGIMEYKGTWSNFSFEQCNLTEFFTPKMLV